MTASKSVLSSTIDTSVAETSASPLYHIIDEDDEPFLSIPRKKSVVDVMGARSAAADVGDNGFILRETTTMHIRESLESSPETICLEDTDL